MVEKMSEKERKAVSYIGLSGGKEEQIREENIRRVFMGRQR